jgi:hypothetical protein
MFGSDVSIQAQLGADAVQMLVDGRASSWSSSVPVLIIRRWGRLSAALNNGVPHCGQKLRRMALPLSALLLYSLTRPITFTTSAVNTALTVALPAAR